MNKLFRNYSLYQRQILKEKVKKISIAVPVVLIVLFLVTVVVFNVMNGKEKKKNNAVSMSSSSTATTEPPTEPLVISETEDNDTYDTANPIPVNTWCTGHLSYPYSSGERDWYKFTLDKEGYVGFDIMTEKQELDRNYWDARIKSFLAPYADIMQSYIQGNMTEFQSETVLLSAGTYLFEIESSKEHSTDEYKFMINYSEANGSNIPKVYRGTYVANQGVSGLDFYITSFNDENEMNAIFDFYPVIDPDIPSGRYTMTGKVTEEFDDGSLKLSFKSSEWLKQPYGYSMIDFDVIIDADRNIIKAYDSDDYDIYLSANTDIIKTFNGHRYCFYESPMSWTDAEKYCESMGGHLVSINSKEEQDFVTKLTSGSYVENVWTGGYYSESEQGWKWSDSSEFSYTNWDTSQPDNHTDTEFYIRYANDTINYEYWSANKGYWNDTDDRADGDTGDVSILTFGFVCEWD